MHNFKRLRIRYDRRLDIHAGFLTLAMTLIAFSDIGARFHHKLVAIHAFPNGNGRHARLATEVILTANGQQNFTWGSKTYSENLDQVSALRSEYIAALREADQRKFKSLIEFVRK